MAIGSSLAEHGAVPGRHRRTLSLTGIVVSAATASLVVIGAGSWLGYQRLSAGDCSGQVKLDVTAATEIAGAVQAAANEWMKGEDAQVDGVCVKVAVTPA